MQQRIQDQPEEAKNRVFVARAEFFFYHVEKNFSKPTGATGHNSCYYTILIVSNLARVLNQIIKQQITCVFISPHLDDAILSAGGLITYLSSKTPVKIITVFTRGSSPCSTLAADYIAACGYKWSEDLFARRRQEDKLVLKKFNLKPIHLNFVDAAWRKTTLGPLNIFHYPQSVLTNKISWLEIMLSQQIYHQLRPNLACQIFAPIGIGTHIDHLIVRGICAKHFPQTIYWADFPYALKQKADLEFIQSQQLQTEFWPLSRYAKLKKYNLIKLYQSQIKPVFGKNDIQITPEKYFLKI